MMASSLMNLSCICLFTRYSEDTPLSSYYKSSFLRNLIILIFCTGRDTSSRNAFAKTTRPKSCLQKTSCLLSSLGCLEQPDVPEQEDDKGKEGKPHLPAYTGALCHTQHTVHGSLELVTRIRELIIHLFRQGSRVADFVANAQGEL